MKRFSSYFFLATIPFFLILLAGLALAQEATPLDDPINNFGDVAKMLYSAMMAKNWWLLGSLLTTLSIAAARTWGGTAIPFLKTKLGGVVMVVTSALSTTIASALMAGQPMSFDLFARAAGIGLAAAGGWSIFKSVKEHFQEQAAAKAGAATPPSILNQ